VSRRHVVKASHHCQSKMMMPLAGRPLTRGVEG
jgi:hypothetical protein